MEECIQIHGNSMEIRLRQKSRRILELNKCEGIIYSNLEGIVKSVLRNKKYQHEKGGKPTTVILLKKRNNKMTPSDTHPVLHS